MSAPLGLAPLAPADGVRAVAGVLALILAPLLAVILVGAVWLGSWLGGAGGGPDGLPAVPPAHLVVMQQVADEYGVPWALLAAIASVESGFGANMATSWAGAIGYGQFLPSSWAAFGAGGDPYDYRDAIPAMARYLVAAGAPGDLPAAVYAYNHSWAYVAEVLGRMTAYASLGPDPASVSPGADGTDGADGGGPVIASRRLAIVVGGLTFALVAAMAASACDAIERLDSRANETAAIERAASAFVVQAGTVGPASTDRYATALLPFATGPLRDALQATVTDSRAGMLARRATVRVERTALTALSRGTGVVTVVAVQSRQWSDARAGIQHDAVRLWLACRLEAVDSRWLVTELRVLAEEPVDAATAGSAFVD